MSYRSHKVIFFIFFMAAFLVSLDADAGLGEPADSVEKDATSLAAVRKSIKSQSSFTIHEVQSDSGTVREYISEKGIVFAIAWEGMVHPDLAQLLASYAEEYNKALKTTAKKAGRRFLQVKGENVVVEKWGHMRRLQGRAYVPALLPAGMNSEDIN